LPIANFAICGLDFQVGALCCDLPAASSFGTRQIQRQNSEFKEQIEIGHRQLEIKNDH